MAAATARRSSIWHQQRNGVTAHGIAAKAAANIVMAWHQASAALMASWQRIEAWRVTALL